MKIKKVLMMVMTLGLGIATVSAQTETKVNSYNPVVTGAPILSITPDARSAAMGGVGLTTSADAHSIYHNISKLAYIDKVWGLSFAFTPWLSEVARDINLSTLAGYFSWGNVGGINHAVGGSVRYFHIGEAQAFQRNTYIPITIVPYEIALDAGYSIAFNEHWSAGVTLRYLRSDYNYSVDEVKGAVNNMFVDLSGTYRHTLRLDESMYLHLRGALALNNVGNKMSYDGKKSYLFAPAVLRIGVGGDLEVNNQHAVGLHLEASKLLAPTRKNNDITKPANYNNMSMWVAMGTSFNDADGGSAEEFREVLWSVGAEYTYDNRFFLRSGYHYQHPSKGTGSGFSMGLGFIYEWAKVDLAYFFASQPKSPLNNTFRLTVGVNF